MCIRDRLGTAPSRQCPRTGALQPASEPPPSSPDEWDFATGLLEVAPEPHPEAPAQDFTNTKVYLNTK
eukprot:10126132-Alexandrium_andersonii.AAC.1